MSQIKVQWVDPTNLHDDRLDTRVLELYGVQVIPLASLTDWLKQLASKDCGCGGHVHRCEDEESLKIYKDETQSEAQRLLAMLEVKP